MCTVTTVQPPQISPAFTTVGSLVQRIGSHLYRSIQQLTIDLILLVIQRTRYISTVLIQGRQTGGGLGEFATPPQFWIGGVQPPWF